MPSPFPGMDPFIEGQEWQDFHSRFIQDISDALIPQVRPRYVVRIERRVYVERDVDQPARTIRPDVAVVTQEQSDPSRAATGTQMALEPVECRLPMPEEITEAYLTIRTPDTMDVITVVELLSPDNKRAGSDGRRAYLKKRGEVLQSSSHLIELDLLRRGERMPTLDPLPTADFYAVVSHAGHRPTAGVYPWALPQPLPAIPVPLRGEDPEVTLCLQEVFSSTYDRAGYDYSLNYERPIDPELSEPEQRWAQEVLEKDR